MVETKLVDIIYLEDDIDWGRFLEPELKTSNLTGLWVEYLEKLETKLDENYRANIYVVDGNFPIQQNGCVSKNAPLAIDLIRNYVENPVILLYSADSSMENIAKEKNVLYLRKSAMGLWKMMEYVQERYLTK